MLDVACGLNPLAILWMPLPGMRGVAASRDVLGDWRPPSADVVLLLKAIPCLEQLSREAVLHLLDTMEAQHVAISFPTRSIGGRDVGMISHYTQHTEALLAQQPRLRPIRTLQFKSELVFILSNAS